MKTPSMLDSRFGGKPKLIMVRDIWRQEYEESNLDKWRSSLETRRSCRPSLDEWKLSLGTRRLRRSNLDEWKSSLEARRLWRLNLDDLEIQFSDKFEDPLKTIFGMIETGHMVCKGTAYGTWWGKLVANRLRSGGFDYARLKLGHSQEGWRRLQVVSEVATQLRSAGEPHCKLSYNKNCNV